MCDLWSMMRWGGASGLAHWGPPTTDPHAIALFVVVESGVWPRPRLRTSTLLS